MEKSSFVIYKSFYEPISSLTDEQMGRLFRAIFVYQNGGEPEVANDILIAYGFFKNQFKEDNKKYDKIMEAKSEAGKRGGGNPNFQKGKSNPYYNKEINKDKQTLTEINRDKLNDNDNDNDNDNVLILSTDANASLSPEVGDAPNEAQKEKSNSDFEGKEAPPLNAQPTENPTARPTVIPEQNAKQVGLGGKEKESSAKERETEGFDYEGFKDFFNAEMGANKAVIPKCLGINEQRKAYLRARIRESGKEALHEAVRKAARSDFLNGKNNKGWIADFAWIFRQNNFPRVLEGNYDNYKMNLKNNQNFNDNGFYRQKNSNRRRETEVVATSADDYSKTF